MWSWYAMHDERGQSLVEASLTLIFLLLLIIAGFELAQVFSHYSALTNATREGALYASSAGEELRLELCAKASLDCDGDPNTQSSTFVCHDTNLDQNDPTEDALYEYCDRIRRTIVVRNIDPDPLFLTIGNPHYEQISTDPDRYKISVQVRYELETLFSSTIELPVLGRMGLPRTYPISYTMVVESRTF